MIYAPPKTISVKNYATTLSPKNSDRLGTSKYVELLRNWGYEIEFGGAIDLYSYGKGDVYILIGPDIELNTEEIKAIESFLSRGGSLLIADELGTVNNILRKLFHASIDAKYLKLYYQRLYGNNETESAPSSKGIISSIYLMAQRALVSSMDNEFKLDRIGNNTDIDSLRRFIIQFYTSARNTGNSNLYSLIPSLSSYINKLGEFKVKGYLMTPSYDYLQTKSPTETLSINITDYSIFIYSAYLDNGEYRVYLIADTSIFTNQYIDINNPTSVYYRFHREVISWLSYNKRGNIIFDDQHYTPLIIKQPVPRLGRMVLDIVINTSKSIMDNYNQYLSSISPIGLTLLLLFWLPSTYLYLKRKVRVKAVREREAEEVVERLLVYESSFMKELGRGGVIKERYRELITGLYDLLNYILEDKLRMTVGEIATKGALDEETLRRYDIDRDRLLKICVRLETLKKKILEARFFPIVISWSREFKKLSKEADYIFSRLGYGFISSDVESGIEDVFK